MGESSNLCLNISSAGESTTLWGCPLGCQTTCSLLGNSSEWWVEMSFPASWIHYFGSSLSISPSPDHTWPAPSPVLCRVWFPNLWSSKLSSSGNNPGRRQNPCPWKAALKLHTEDRTCSTMRQSKALDNTFWKRSEELSKLLASWLLILVFLMSRVERRVCGIFCFVSQNKYVWLSPLSTCVAEFAGYLLFHLRHPLHFCPWLP